MSSSEGEAALAMQLDHRGDRVTRHGVALIDADDAAALDDRGEDVHRDLGVRGGRADDAAHASRREDVDRLAQDGRDARGLERAVDSAATGDLLQRVDGIVLARVDRVGGAEPGRQLETGRVDVDDHDRRPGQMDGGDHGAEADAAGTEDRERRARLGAQDVYCESWAGLNGRSGTRRRTRTT